MIPNYLDKLSVNTTLNGVELDMMHLKLSKLLDVHDVVNVLLKVITNLQPHVGVDIPPNRLHSRKSNNLPPLSSAFSSMAQPS